MEKSQVDSADARSKSEDLKTPNPQPYPICPIRAAGFSTTDRNGKIPCQLFFFRPVVVAVVRGLAWAVWTREFFTFLLPAGVRKEQLGVCRPLTIPFPTCLGLCLPRHQPQAPYRVHSTSHHQIIPSVTVTLLPATRPIVYKYVSVLPGSAQEG